MTTNWYAEMMLEKLGPEKLRLHIDEMKYKIHLLKTEGMKKLTHENIAKLEKVLLERKCVEVQLGAVHREVA